MKNILMMILGFGLSLSAFAGQPKIASGTRIGGGGAPAKVIVVRPAVHAYGYYPYRFGYNPFYSPFYSYGYNPYFYGAYAYRHRPTKLDLEIEQITNDYHHQIADVRHDETLSKAERTQKIRDLRHERQNSIIEAKKGYYSKQEKDSE